MVTLVGVLRAVIDLLGPGSPSSRSRSAPSPSVPSPSAPSRTAPSRTGGVSGGRELFVYAARDDGHPDPGEVVWTWVAYEDDPSRGKDRPVLVVGREGDQLLALALTSKDHDRDAGDERRHGRSWMDVGSGAWDTRRRPSEVRLDRLLRLDPSAVRREGAALDPAIFRQVGEAARPFLTDRR